MSTDKNVGVTLGEVKGLFADLNEKLTSDTGQEWHQALKIFLKKQNPWAEAIEKAVVMVKGFLKELKIIAVEAVKGKNTSDCFLGSRYDYRDGSLDSWLPKVQSESVSGTVVAHELTRDMTLVGMVQSLLGTLENDVETLSRMAIDKKCDVTLPLVESLIERSDAGEDVGLRTDGYANLFLVKEKDGKTVSVVSVSRYGGRWIVYVNRLDRGHRWYVELRFFSRN